jgi:hypothetical protein
MFQRTAISEDKSFVYSLGKDLSRIEEAKKVYFNSNLKQEILNKTYDLFKNQTK